MAYFTFMGQDFKSLFEFKNGDAQKIINKYEILFCQKYGSINNSHHYFWVKQSHIIEMIVLQKDIESLKMILSNGYDEHINDVAGAGFTLLHTASINGYNDIVKLLLTYEKININKLTNDGYTSLSLAIRHNHDDVVQTLKLNNKIV